MNSPARQARNRHDRNRAFDQSTARRRDHGLHAAVGAGRRRTRRARRRGPAPRRPGSRRAIVGVARAQEHVGARRPAAASAPRPAAAPTTPCSAAEQVGGRGGPGRLLLGQPRLPSRRRSARGRPACRRRWRSTSSSGIGWVTVDALRPSRRRSSRARPAGRCRCRPSARRSMKTVWSGKIDSSSPSMTLRWNSSGSRKHGGPADGHDHPGADRLDVAQGPGELRLDLLVDQLAHDARAGGRTPSGTRWPRSTAATGCRPDRRR